METAIVDFFEAGCRLSIRNLVVRNIPPTLEFQLSKAISLHSDITVALVICKFNAIFLVSGTGATYISAIIVSTRSITALIVVFTLRILSKTRDMAQNATQIIDHSQRQEMGIEQ